MKAQFDPRNAFRGNHNVSPRPARARSARRRGGPGRATSRLLALAVGLSAAGDMLALITLALRVHDLTGSGFAVSALFAPRCCRSWRSRRSAGGADRLESARVLLAASLAQAAVAAALALA